MVARIRGLVAAIRDGDPSVVERSVLDLSRSRRILAPLGFLVGAFVMLFDALRLLFTNWRLLLVEILPAMWIWLAMYDIRAHLLFGASFRTFSPTLSGVLVVVIVAVTALGFFLNAVFAFAIDRPGPPQIRPAFSAARERLAVILAWGVLVGLVLGFAAVITPRWGTWKFSLAMSAVVGLMMLTYVTVPARLVGVRAGLSRRDKVGTMVITGALGALVCTPAYLFGRLGILLLGSRTLFAVGVVLLLLGLILQVGGTGAVKAMKMSATLLAGRTSRRTVRRDS